MPWNEVEIKLEVKNPRALRQRLARLGFRIIVARHFESNVMFDFKNRRLRREKCILRLRLADHQGLLTFKTAPRPSRKYKIRGEIETRVDDRDRMRQILENLGMHESFRYEKYRTMYAPCEGPRKGHAPTLVFDQTPIGNYLELEGPERWIDKAARDLGYHREDYITASYGALYRQYCQERGKKPKNMIFPRRKT